jgi:hypothetical protein
MYVSHQNRDSTDRFVHRHNIEHFSRLLKIATSKAERDKLSSFSPTSKRCKSILARQSNWIKISSWLALGGLGRKTSEIAFGDGLPVITARAGSTSSRAARTRRSPPTLTDPAEPRHIPNGIATMRNSSSPPWRWNFQ